MSVFFMNVLRRGLMQNRILAVCALLCSVACTQTTPSSDESEKQPIEISDCFNEVLRINLNDHDLGAFTPSNLLVKGVIEDSDTTFVLYDYSLKECLVYNKKNNKVERTFELPKHDGWERAHLLEVVSLDSILYFDHDHQSLVVCNTEEIKNTYYLKFEKEHHQPYQNIQHLHRFLRSIDGYIGFNTWIAYGDGGVDVDYDTYMDERDMVCFFKVQGDSLISRDIPIKPFLKKTTYPDVMYVDNPFFEVNSQKREILVFHQTTDTIYTYGWDDERIEKHVVSGSEIELIPPKVPRRGSSADIVMAYENQECGHHRIYYDAQSAKYLRHLIKEFPTSTTNGLPPRPDIRLLQVLNDNFEVEAEMELPEEYKQSKRVGVRNYLRKYDNESRELVVYRFEWVEG